MIPRVYTNSDNTNVRLLASNVMFYSRIKQIEIDVHFVREQVATQSLKIQYVPTQHQIVDILTKSLSVARF